MLFQTGKQGRRGKMEEMNCSLQQIVLFLISKGVSSRVRELSQQAGVMHCLESEVYKWKE